MNHTPLLTIVIVLCLTSSCKYNNNPVRPDTTSTESEFSTLGIDQETFTNLLGKVDHIDATFYNLPLSMNQDGKNVSYQDLQYVSSKPVEQIPDNCTPLARKIFLSEGEILMEADVYYSKECQFIVFIKDEKKLYGNYFTQAGMLYYEKLLLQIEASKPEGIL